MPEKVMFQVQNSRGHLHTLIGFSHKGVIRDYIEQYPTQPGETLQVKRRGYGPEDWQAFRLS